MKYTPNIWETIKVPGIEFTDFYDVYEEAVENAPNNAVLVEVGSWIGKSTTMMLELLKSRDKIATFYAIDNFILNVAWSSKDNCYIHTGIIKGGCLETENIFKKNIQLVDLSDYVGIKFDYIKKDSLTAAKDFNDESVDFVFIDANHTYDAIRQDLEAWWPKIKSGGTMAGHDFTWLTLDGIQGVGRAVWEFAHKNKLRFSVSNSSWIIKKL